MEWKDNKNDKKYTLKSGYKLLDLKSPLVMGIINATPDSFYSESRKQSIKEVVNKVREMIADGAKIIDIGGMSTRPNAEMISIEEEIQRVTPVLESVREEFPEIWISLDTFRSEVVEACLEYKIDIVNDVTGGNGDSKMFDVVAKNKLTYILMHSRGNPSTMQSLTDYKNVVQDVVYELSLQIKKAEESGIKDIIVDPGFGFAKNLEQNYELINRLDLFHELNYPLLVGVSRKSMIYKLLDTSPEEAIHGTTTLNVLALQKGASILRVHDVKPAMECIKIIGLPR